MPPQNQKKKQKVLTLFLQLGQNLLQIAAYLF